MSPTPSGPRRRVGLVAALAVLAVVVAAGLIAWLVLAGGDDPNNPKAGPPRTSGGSGTSSESSPAPEVTADGMENFVEDYLATVTTDQAAAWDRLTPSFQAESGGFGQYQKFWRDMQSADIVSSQADPSTLEFSYTVEYVHQDGNTSSDNVTLHLEGTDGDYLIAAES